MKFTTSSLALLSILSVIAGGFAHPGPYPEPAPEPEAEPGVELLKRAGMANVITKCTRPNTVALTFDDGPYIYETELSNLLVRNGIKGTFFVNGNLYNCIYDQRQVDSLRNTFAAGHQVASHTWSHPDLTTLSQAQINTEMQRVEEALNKILGIQPAFMRPPYGNYNNLVRQVAGNRNQTLVNWDLYSGDANGAPVSQQQQTYATAVNSRPSTILALNHEPYQSTVQQTIPYAINLLKSRGYTFATVAECLGQSPYTSVKPAGVRDSTWRC